VIDSYQGALVRYLPSPGSDLGRALGLASTGETGGIEAPIDALYVEPGGYAVNGVVLGTPPGRLGFTAPSAAFAVSVNGKQISTGRATTVVIANGQFFDGLDVVPRGHPGDGRAEVQVYRLGRAERRAMRARLPQGAHLPHPHIVAATGREIEVRLDGGRAPLWIDGVARDAVSELTVTVIPGALRLAL
jgi:hypothetical protein